MTQRKTHTYKGALTRLCHRQKFLKLPELPLSFFFFFFWSLVGMFVRAFICLFISCVVTLYSFPWLFSFSFGHAYCYRCSIGLYNLSFNVVLERETKSSEDTTESPHNSTLRALSPFGSANRQLSNSLHTKDTQRHPDPAQS